MLTRTSCLFVTSASLQRSMPNFFNGPLNAALPNRRFGIDQGESAYGRIVVF